MIWTKIEEELNKKEWSVYKLTDVRVQKMQMKSIRIQNWLMHPDGKSILKDDAIPGYYFMAEVEEGVGFEEDFNRGLLTVNFEAYPFMINELPEGHGIWDEFNFELDVAQPTRFDLTVSWDRFKELDIGDEATYGAWATQYLGGNPIDMQMLGRTYQIVDKRYINQSKSRIAYKFDEINEWLIEQDVVQAQTEYLDFNLINAGISEVSPKITVDSKITLIKDEIIYNLMPGIYENSLFTLGKGDNYIQGYTADVDTTLDFEWYKELI